jgi:hypothetical protein
MASRPGFLHDTIKIAGFVLLMIIYRRGETDFFSWGYWFPSAQSSANRDAGGVSVVNVDFYVKKFFYKKFSRKNLLGDGWRSRKMMLNGRIKTQSNKFKIFACNY